MCRPAFPPAVFSRHRAAGTPALTLCGLSLGSGPGVLPLGFSLSLENPGDSCLSVLECVPSRFHSLGPGPPLFSLGSRRTQRASSNGRGGQKPRTTACCGSQKVSQTAIVGWRRVLTRPNKFNFRQKDILDAPLCSQLSLMSPAASGKVGAIQMFIILLVVAIHSQK